LHSGGAADITRVSLAGSTALFGLGSNEAICWRKGVVMDGTTIIRIVAGVLFVIVLVLLIQRRRTRVK
jgi:hypothetical protein